MSARLPDALSTAVARLTHDVAPKALAARSASLTKAYRAGSRSAAAVVDERDVAAYLATRLPATYAAMAAALGAVTARAPRFAPTTLLDAGAGPGTACWAALETWPGVQSIAMLERNPHMRAAAHALAQASPHPSLAAARFISGDLAEAGVHSRRYDLVLAGYIFAELPASKIEDSLVALWRACSGVFVIVEPGTPSGFATILSARTVLVAAGARVLAPCAGAYACPIVAPDWCHFAQRLPRSRAHMRAKAARVPFEDEKFSYLAVARDGVELAPAKARIVAPPRLAKPGIRFRLCSDAGLTEQTVLKRDKPAYRAVARKRWGDAL